MADRFPNIPNTPTEFVDGNLFPDALPQGAVVAVVGSATRGPSRVGSRVLSESGGLTRFGNVGSLARGLSEVFQGGTSNTVAVRMFSTSGKVDHIGASDGVAGILLQTTVEGSDSLAQYSVIYDGPSDRLRVFNVSSGALVLDKTGDVLDVDVGEVIVDGAATNDYEADPRTFGSLGKRIPLLPDESLQKATLTAGGATITLVPAAGLNVGRLGYLGAQTPIAVQILNEDGDALCEVRVSGVNTTTGVITLSPAVAADFGDGSEDDGAREHSVRFVSLFQAERLDRVALNRLQLAASAGPDVLVTPGSDFNGLPLVVNANGVRVDADLAEVQPHVMNKYEALVEAQDVLESARIDALVFVDAYFDEPALDGQTIGETALPEDADTGLLGESDGSDALVSDLVAVTVEGFADRVLVTATDNADRNVLVAGLASAGRGRPWIVFDEAIGADFADDAETDELVRTARILNWEEIGLVEVSTVTTIADVADALDADHFRFHDGTTAYYVWYDASGTAVDPAIAAHTGIEVTIDTGDSAIAVATATLAAIEASAARVTVTRDSATLTITNLDVANVVATSAQTSGFTVATTSIGTDPQLLLHFDRNVSFTGLETDAVAADANPSFKIYNVGLMFFYRNFVKDGQVKHCWYTSKYDPEGNQYHEVNLGYKLAAICHSLTESETPVLGYIGARPPANLFRKKDIDAWIGTAPLYDQEGNVVRNGTGLLGNKFMAGRGLDGNYDLVSQFSPGFKLTVSGELDDENVLLDANEFEVDLGKFLNIVTSWTILNNAFAASQASRAGYPGSGVCLYTGLANALAPWSATTQKSIGRGGVRLPTVIGKAKVNALAGTRYVVLSQDSAGNVVVVDGPSAALPTSDFTRNMSMRLVSEMIRNIRDAARPFLGEPLGPLQKTALETALNTALNATKQTSQGALQGFSIGLAQTDTDRILGRVRVRLAASVIFELRKIFIEVSLTR